MINQVFKLRPGTQQKALKIVFFGTSEFAVPALESLVNFGYNIVAVVTQPEKPIGKAKVVMPSPVKKSAISHNITVLEPHNLRKDEKFFEDFSALGGSASGGNEPIDLCIVAAYGKIIPSRYLEIPKYGFINIHPSLLPKYRGPSPIQAAIINGDTETGISIMLVDEQMDHGPVLATTKYRLSNSKFFSEINNEMWKMGAELLIDTIPNWIGGRITPIPQKDEEAVYCKLLTRSDSKIDWNKTAEEIYNKIRAFNPEPGTWTTWKSKILNISTCEVENISTVDNQEPGKIIKVGDLVAVATKKCYLILKQIQLEGRKEMDAKAFLNGHPDFLGSKLG